MMGQLKEGPKQREAQSTQHYEHQCPSGWDWTACGCFGTTAPAR